MKNYTKIIILGILFCFSNNLFGNEFSEYDKWVKEGKRQYNTLIKYNAENKKKGKSDQNWYIFSFLPEEDWLQQAKGKVWEKPLAGSDWVQNNDNTLDAAFLVWLNQKMTEFNTNNSMGIEMYMTVSSQWKLYLPWSFREELGSSSNTGAIIGYMEDQIKKEKFGDEWKQAVQDYQTGIKERFRSLITEIMKSPANPETYFSSSLPDTSRVLYSMAKYSLMRKEKGDDENVEIKLGTQVLHHWSFPKDTRMKSCLEKFETFVNAIPRFEYQTSSGQTNTGFSMGNYAENAFLGLQRFVDEDRCFKPTDCQYLLESGSPYHNHPYLQEDNFLRTAILNNPCLLLNLQEIQWNPGEETEFMRELNEIMKWFCIYTGGTLAGMAILEAGALEIIMAELGREKATQFATGAAFDFAIQMVMQRYFPTSGTAPLSWSEAAEKSNVYQAAVAGSINIFETQLNSVQRAALQAAADCMIQGNFDTDGTVRENFSGKDCALGAGVAFVTTIAFDKAAPMLKHLKKLSPSRLMNGIKKMMDDFSALSPPNSSQINPSFSCGMASCIFYENFVGKLKVLSASCAIWDIYKAVYKVDFLNPAKIKDLLKIDDSALVDQIIAAYSSKPQFKQIFFDEGMFYNLINSSLTRGNREDLIKLFLDNTHGNAILAKFKNSPILTDVFQGAKKEIDEIKNAASGGVAKVKTLFDDIDLTLASKIIANPKLVSAWDGLSSSELLRKSVEVLEKAGELLNAKFSKSTLENLSNVANKILGNIDDGVIILISKNLSDSQLKAKAFKNFNINTDIISQMKILLNSSKLENIHSTFMKANGQIAYELSNFVSLLKKANNPGFIEQLNEAVKRVQVGSKVHLEGIAKKGDIVDIKSFEALQIKALTTKNKGKVSEQLTKAVTQFSSEIPPTGYSKIAEVRILNPVNEISSYSPQQLKNWLEAINPSLLPQYQTMDKIRIQIPSGIYDFKFNELGNVIQL